MLKRNKTLVTDQIQAHMTQKEVKHEVQRSKKLTLIRIRKNCHSKGIHLLSGLLINRVLKLTAIIIQVQHCYQRHKILSSTNLSRSIPYADNIICEHSENFILTDQLQIRDSICVQTLKKWEYSQAILNYLQTYRMLLIQLAEKYCVILAVSSVHP